MNDEQVKGFAGILDNLAVVAIGSWVLPFFGFGSEQAPWLIFLLSLAALACAYGAFCLRKLLSSSGAQLVGSPGHNLQPSSPPSLSSPSSSLPMTTPPPAAQGRSPAPMGEDRSAAAKLKQAHATGVQGRQQEGPDKT